MKYFMRKISTPTARAGSFDLFVGDPLTYPLVDSGSIDLLVDHILPSWPYVIDNNDYS